MTAHSKILIIRLKSIGDIIQTLPAVHVVRENFPDAKIAFLVSKEHAPLLSGFRDVDEVIPLDRAPYHRKNPKDMVRETFSLLRELRRKKFSLTVDLQGYGETALLTLWTRARERWCDAYRREWHWAYTKRFGGFGRVHPAERHVCLLRQCGLRVGPVRNEYVLPDKAVADAREFCAAQRVNPAKPMLFIQPFTSNPRKDWTLENYLKLARHWRERGTQIIFGGGPVERPALETVRQAGFTVSAGVPLLTTAGLMKLSRLVVGGDTGLLHLAVAMNRRVVMLMMSAAPGKPHPYQHADWAVAPADRQDINRLPPGTVIEACTQAWSESGAVGRGS